MAPRHERHGTSVTYLGAIKIEDQRSQLARASWTFGIVMLPKNREKRSSVSSAWVMPYQLCSANVNSQSMPDAKLIILG